MISIKDVHKTFNPGSANEKRALNGVNLQLDEGDFVTVIGGNGAGKSTLLNIISGVYKADKGKITIDDILVNNQAEYKRAAYIGRVFQDPMLGTAASMTIEENLAMALRRGKRRTLKWGITGKEHVLFQEQLAQLELGLEDRLKSKVGLLSGGQRQAVTLLMATITHPKLLLLDEHTAALDPKTAVKVLELTEKIVRAASLTTLMVTHNMRDAIRYGNRLIMMHDGKPIINIDKEEKAKLKVEDLLTLFEKASGSELANDRMLLS